MLKNNDIQSATFTWLSSWGCCSRDCPYLKLLSSFSSDHFWPLILPRQFRTKNERWAMRAEAAHQWRNFTGGGSAWQDHCLECQDYQPVHSYRKRVLMDNPTCLKIWIPPVILPAKILQMWWLSWFLFRTLPWCQPKESSTVVQVLLLCMTNEWKTLMLGAAGLVTMAICKERKWEELYMKIPTWNQVEW